MNVLFRSIALQLERPVDELDVTGMTLLGHFSSNRRGGLVTQAGLDDSLAGKGWRRESIIAPGGSWGLEHQRISIKEVSVWGSGRGRRMVVVVGWGGSPHCPNSDWEQEEGSGTALCLQLLWRRWLLGGMAKEGWGMGRLLTLHLVWTKSLAHSPLLSLCPGLPCLRVPWILSLSAGTPTNSNLHRRTLWGLSAL